MKIIALVLHSLIVMLVIALSIWEAWNAFELFGKEYLALTYGRSAPAILCGSYAIAHVVLLIKKCVTTQALLWFYPLCFSLGIAAVIVSQGYGKGWAPANPEQAFQSNVIGFSIVGLLWLTAAYTCYCAFISKVRSEAY